MFQHQEELEEEDEDLAPWEDSEVFEVRGWKAVSFLIIEWHRWSEWNLTGVNFFQYKSQEVFPSLNFTKRKSDAQDTPRLVRFWSLLSVPGGLGP